MKSINESISESLNEGEFITKQELSGMVDDEHKYTIKLLRVLRRHEDITHDEHVELLNMILGQDVEEIAKAQARINVICGD